MRYLLYDTKKVPRDIFVALEPDELRVSLSLFKTHCAESDKEYEFNHYKNWLRLNAGIEITYSDISRAVRVDM